MRRSVISGQNSMDEPTSPRKEETGYYDAYADFARNLRTWLIAYGVGGPVIFLTNESASEALVQAEIARPVAQLFLAGVALQVMGAVVYKSAMWYLYVGETESAFRRRWRYKVADWISESHAIELVVDLGTIVLFTLATVAVLDAFAGP